MARLLEGIRVLDLSNVLSGPFCGQQLAMLGAEVVKIETPGEGDLARRLGADPVRAKKGMGVSFLANNAGKKSVTLNLKHERGKALFREMVKSADALLENFRPGVMQRLGLGYEALKEINPRLVYCALSGFGQTGPLAERPAYDQIIQGYSGIMSITGDTESAPLRVGYAVCDTIGGMTAAFAMCAALYRRQVSGGGTMIDVSMLDATLVQMGFVTSNYMNTGIEPEPMGNQNATAAPSGTFHTGDGLLNIAANEQKQYEALCDAIGTPELKTDARFAERYERRKRRAELNPLIESALTAKSAQEWESLLNARGVPCGRVLTVPEILNHAQIAERGLLKNFDHVPGADTPLSITRCGFRLSGEAPDVESPPPRLGEHTAQYLAEVGVSDGELAELRKNGTV
jgi:crotonobetainyl-CoA:carnitine CoA-transferase CaiB-like acyl-CoA transferase